jgi:cytochrome c oxidase subunit 2
MLRYGLIGHNKTAEIIWTITPTIILYFIAIPSFALLYAMEEVFTPSLTFKAIGHQWFWSYECQDGGFNESFDSNLLSEDDLILGDYRLLEVDNPLILPTDTHIRVLVTSTDVLHSWAVPRFGIKMDAVPGRLNQTFIYIKHPGLFFGQCSELCGIQHGFMPIKILAVGLNEFSSINATPK